MTKVERLTRRNLILGAIALALAVYIVVRPPSATAVRTTGTPNSLAAPDAARMWR